MAANFPGAGNAVPQSVVQVDTLSQGASIPSGSRTAAIMGEGLREETLVLDAVGGGNDGLNPSYTSTNGSDGRHFATSVFPLISNRTRLFKNGIELNLLEDSINSNSFDGRFDARVEISTGHIELQRAHLVDQGGEYFKASGSNVGDGTISNLTLVDNNAPAETWTVRCSTVRRDGYGNPIDGYAIFTVRGSVSGVILDGYGNQITWQSNGTLTSNGILQFSIVEGSVAFREGDTFIIETDDGALVEGDNLTVRYIASTDIDDPEFFTDINVLAAKHGRASLDNTLALGAQLAFANGTPGVWAIQAAPALPRRVSYTLVTSANGESDEEDLTFNLPLNVTPDVDSKINFFVTDPVTGVESQILPNKIDFYDPAITASPSSFIFGPSYSYSYTVILDDAVVKSANDGVLTSVTGTTATLSSATVAFGIDDLSGTRSIRIKNSGSGNDGTYSIVSISNGVLTISDAGGFSTESPVEFEVLDSVATSARILFTDDLALSLGQSLRATVVDTKDADFFDAGWTNAYASAEKIETSMIVPLPKQTISVIFQNGKIHVEKMSQIKQKRERLLFIGAISGLTPANVIGTEPAAVEDIGILEGIQGDDVEEVLSGSIEDLADYGVQDAFGDSYRVVYFYPDQIVVQVGSSQELIDGFYLAAAAAGWFSGKSQINLPLTNKTLSGFTILRDKLFAPITVENITAAGITLLQPVIGGGRVIWGKTTTTSGFAEEEEISVVFIRDAIARDLRNTFRGFIGQPESPTFQSTLYARAVDAMQAFLSRRLITDYRDLVVVQDSSEPRQWNIRVGVQPVFPVNWIYIRVDFGFFG